MPSSSPASLRTVVLLLAAGAATHSASATICTGTENATSASMSCDGLVNFCNSSGLCVVGTDGKCCSVFTDAKDGETDCVMKDLEGFLYTTDCPMEGFGITAFCSGVEDMDDFSMSCGGLVDTCTSEGLCVVNGEGICCSVYTDATPTDCVAKTPPEGKEYSTTCEKGAPPTSAPTESPTTTLPPPSPTFPPTYYPTTFPPTAPDELSVAPTRGPTSAPITSPTTTPPPHPTAPPNMVIEKPSGASARSQTALVCTLVAIFSVAAII